MKRVIWIIGLILLCLTGFAQSKARKILNKAYMPGEELKYSLYYGWLEGGMCSISIKEVDFEGQKVYHAVAMGKTSGIADKMFGVHDVFESYFNKETGLPIKKIRNIKEGKYKQYNEARFDRDSNTITSIRGGLKKSPEYILDIVSVFYYLRCMDIRKLKNGDVVKTTIFIDDRIFPFDIRYKGIETIDTDKGYIQCYKFMPYTEPGSTFKNNDDLSMWLSADANMIPIRIKMNLWIGSVNCDLIDYKNIKTPLLFTKDK